MPEELARSPSRGRLLRVVGERPGIAINELRRVARLPWGTFSYHFDKLRRAGLVEIRASGQRKLVFLPHECDEEIVVVAPLRNPTARLIADAIRAHPGIGIPDLLRVTRASPRALYYHVRQLRQAGLVLSASRTRHVELRASAALVTALARMPVEDA